MSEENTNPEVTTTETTTVSTDWKDSISEDLRSDSSLADIKDVESLAKSYINGQKMLGSSVRIPSEDASAEAKDSFYKSLENVQGVARIDSEDKSDLYNKLGRPESAEDYKINTPEGIELNNDRLSKYAEAAHKAGLSNTQFNDLVQVQLAEAQAEAEAATASFEAGEKSLKEAWGKAYEGRIEEARAAANTLGEKNPEAMQALLNSEAANNPVVMQAFYELAQAMKESGALSPTSSGNAGGLTPDEAQAQIEEIRMNKAHPYHNHRDPGHAAAVEKVNKLYQFLSV